MRSLTRISGRRRDGLRTLLTRKTPPKGTAGFVAATLADHAEIVAQVGGNHWRWWFGRWPGGCPRPPPPSP